jgi:RNA polymerase sigma factor (sigma-70 family)
MASLVNSRLELGWNLCSLNARNGIMADTKSQSMTSLPGGGAFLTTRWTVVLAAGNAQDPHSKQALATLCQTYWRPLYVFVRRRGYSPADAEDLVQEFFERLLERGIVGQADQDRGRFRTFLLSALDHFLVNEWTRQRTLKRGGGLRPVSWDGEGAEECYARELADKETPATAFDRHWAEALLEHALAQLRRQYAATGKAELFEALEPQLSGESPGSSCRELATRLGMSEGALRAAVHRLRRGFGEILRLEVAHTVTSPAEIDDELRYLFALFRR